MMALDFSTSRRGRHWFSPALLVLLFSLWSPLGAQTVSPTESGELALLPRRQPSDSVFLTLKSRYMQALNGQQSATAAGYLQEMGRLCVRLGHYPQAFDFYRQAGTLLAKGGTATQRAGNLSALGELYYANRQPRPAREQFARALALYQQAADANGVATTYGQLGHLYEKEQRYDSAFYCQRLALREFQQARNQRGLAKIFENLGSVFEDLAQYDSARIYFQRALRLTRQNGDELAQIEILNNLGDVLRKTGQYRAGLGMTRQALTLACRLGEYHQLGGAYNDLGKSYHLLGRSDSAYYFTALSRRYLAAIYSADNNQQLALLQTLYEVQRKNQEISQLQNARTLNRLLAAGGAAGALLLLLLGGVIISRQRLKIRTAQTLHEQHEQIHRTQRELIQVELRNKELEEANLRQELAARSRELTTHTLHIVQKNQLLEDLRGQLSDLVKDDKRDQKKQLRQLLHQIGQGFHHDQHWENFRQTFEQVHQPFFERLQQHCDSLTPGERRLAALLRLNLKSQDIATSLGVSADSLRVMRYRLRKRLNLAGGENLGAFLQNL